MKKNESDGKNASTHETHGLLRVKDVAKKLDLAESTVYAFARHGIIPCVKLGRSTRFRPESLERYLDSREKEIYGRAA